MSDHAQIGVRVFEHSNRWYRANDVFEATHLAIPLDAESLAGLRERIAQANPEAWMLNAGYRMGVETTFAALGLEP